jgi:hypothetical protein
VVFLVSGMGSDGRDGRDGKDSEFQVDLEHPPRVVGRVNYHPSAEIPLRGYIHEAGFEDWNGETRVAKMGSAMDYLKRQWDDVSQRMRKEFDYAYGFVWHEQGEGLIDFFGGKLEGGVWSANPEITGWTMRNGVEVPDTSTTCGDGTIILGLEEMYRRRTGSKAEFARNPPVIRNLPLEIDTNVTLV